jgi:DNA-binding MarR family transcriptional regulator
MTQISHEDAARLLASVSALADHLGCGFGEAAARLTDLAVSATGGTAAAPVSPRNGRRAARDFARDLLRIRSRRCDILGAEIFRDPAWDMLLDLYAHNGIDGAMMVSALCVGSGVPQTTALRHVHRLEQSGLVECTDHPADQRRTMVRLTAPMEPRIERLLAMIQDCA